MKKFLNNTLWAVVLLPFVAAKPLPACELAKSDSLMSKHYTSEKFQTHVQL